MRVVQKIKQIPYRQYYLGYEKSANTFHPFENQKRPEAKAGNRLLLRVLE